MLAEEGGRKWEQSFMITYLSWRRRVVVSDQRLVDERSKDLVADERNASKHSETQHDCSRRPSRAANVGGNGVVIALDLRV